MDPQIDTDSNYIRAIGGLIAVVVGIGAVVALAVITITRLGAEDKESMVAITSSAFGIISALVGAYLGIKISAETSRKAGEQAGRAVVAEQQRDVARQQLSALKAETGEGGPSTSDPPPAGGSA